MPDYTYFILLFICQRSQPSAYDRINHVRIGYDQKLHRDDRAFAKSRGLYVNNEVRCTKNAQVVTDLQTSCNKVVVKPISGCVRTACSQLL
jgi:hypothetical protein